jgi:hypothetical protein
MLKLVLLLISFSFPLGWARAEVNDIAGTFTQSFHYYVLPGFEYDFAWSDLSGQGGLKTGPRIFTRIKIERENMFFAPDIGLGVMSGLRAGNPVFITGGFIAGVRSPPPTVGFYGGVSCDSFSGDGAPTGVAFRMGFDMDYRMNGGQFFTELRAGGISEHQNGASITAPYFGIHSGVQFLIGL